MDVKWDWITAAAEARISALVKKAVS